MARSQIAVGRWLFLALVGLVLSAPALAQAPKRVALVIGNAAYANAPALANPVNDAKSVADALKRLGFEVHLGLDLTQAQTVKQLDAFAAAVRGADVALLYYSGHGLQLGGGNFLLPTDIDAASERSVRYGAIDVAEIVRDMEKNADIALAILDACRDNPFLNQLEKAPGATRSVSASRGLALIKPAGSGTIIAYSAAAGAVASDGDTDHSPYTKALLDQVEAPNVEVGLMFRRVAGKVVSATAGSQRPEVLISLTREYYMNEQAGAPAPPSPAVIATAPVAAQPVPADLPPAPVFSPVAPATASPEPRRTASPSPAARPPYADLLARLTLNQPAYAPPKPWSAPERRSTAEAEPNNTAGTANPVGINDIVRLSINPVGEADWFYFTAGAGGGLRVRADRQPPEIDLAVRVLDADRRALADFKTTPRPGGVLDASFDLPGEGTYWLEVRDGGNNGVSPQSIDLALAFTPQEDLYEPNNLQSRAKVLPMNGSRRIALFPVGDADHFLFAAERPGELVVAATDVPDDIDVALRLVDADQNTVAGWFSAARPGADTEGVIELKQPGLYVLEVRDGGNDHGSVKGFDLTSRFTPSPDPYEPNDSIAAAAPVPASGEHTITILPQGDVDYLAIDVDGPGELQISATGVPRALDVVFRVISIDQREIAGWSNPARRGGDTVGLADLPRAGRYLIEVRDGGNDAGTVEPFKLRTRFIQSPDQYEPNDTVGRATEIRAGGEIAVNIFPIGDADWFKLRVDQPGELALAIDDGPANLDINFRILDSERRDLTGWIPPYSKGGRTEGFADLRTPGVYFIEVRDGGNDGRSIQPATLSTRFTPTAVGYEPDDTFGTAAKLPLTGSNLGTILPVGDADWQVVYAPSPGELTVTVDQVPAELDVVFRVLEADQRDLTGWQNPPRKGGLTTGKAKIERPGWYWIEIRDGGNDARSPVPFRVTREFAAAAR